MERRNSPRLALDCNTTGKVREKNGEYLFSYQATNLSSDGIFLIGKICFSQQEHHSTLSFTLPSGKHLTDIKARIVRENRKGEPKGCAYEFLNLSEDVRMELLRCLASQAAS
jgi:c-di-GMP-binding flagellar brake protein YcgR